MLCQFSFENYKSFKNEATLDFFAESVLDNSKSLIIDKYTSEKFLPVTVIYGPNGGGKSNSLEAVEFLFNFVTNPILSFKFFGKPSKNKNQQMFRGDKYHKFDFKCKELPTKFDILFRINSYEYRYTVAISDDKIEEENLYFRNLKTNEVDFIFERNNDDIKCGKIIEDVVINRISTSISFLTFLAFNYDIKIIDSIIIWFYSAYFLDYSNSNTEKNMYLPMNKKNSEAFYSMLKEMGINIHGVRAEKDSNGKIKRVYMKHKLNNGNLVEISGEDESMGTKKILSFLPLVIETLRNGSFLVADELDAKLHPKLLKYIIELFTNPEINKKGAQLLFTSHDISTMNSEIFRRDEICFCALNPDNASKLYSLISLRDENGNLIKKDAAFGKQYLEGRYGADPYLRKMLNWGENA